MPANAGPSASPAPRTPVALDLDHEMQRVIGAVVIIHQHNEVRSILPRLGTVAIGHFQPEIMVFSLV